MSQAANWSVPLIGPVTPTAMAGRIDDSLDALLSAHAGATRPSYAVAGTMWLNTATAGQHRYYWFDGTSDHLVMTIETATGAVILNDIEPRIDVASAATTNIGAANSQNVNITGTTTITAFDAAAAGVMRFVRFAGALTLTHNGISLVLPNGGANIATAAGDHCIAMSMGSGNWIVTHYQRASVVPSAFAATFLDDASGAAVWASLGALASVGATGYFKLPDGTIVQYGSTAGVTNGSGNATMTFPISFPNSRQTFICAWGDGSTGNHMVQAIGGSLSGNNVIVRLANTGAAAASTAYRINWIAIGD